ncbi:MAG TPA: nucleotidyltransferase domain-containing protein [Methylococcales bacterium]
MDKKAVLAVISDFKKALAAENIRPEKIILFGSYADGTHRPDSDIDLVVISEDFKDKDYWQRIDILSSAVYKVFMPIEAIAMTWQEWQSGDSMITDYAANGEVIVG